MTQNATDEQIIKQYDKHVYFEDRVTPKGVESIIIGKIMNATRRSAKGTTDLWLIQQSLIDFILPQITNRDEEIATLKARVAEPEAADAKRKRRAQDDADFEDWKTGRGKAES